MQQLGGSPGAYNVERYRKDFADIYFPAMALTGRPYGEPWCKDGISVRNLSFAISPQAGCDAWGRQKEQPCLVSVSLSFRSSYTSAARKDTLDESTMHYGILAKRLRAIKPSNDWQSIDQLADAVSQTILDTPPGSGLVKACQIEVHLPKASMLGDGVTFIRSTSFGNVASAATRRMLHLQNVRIPTLIGVNAHERTRKQPLIVSLWVDGLQYGTAETYPELETELVDIIEPTAFETLESLAVHTVDQLYERILKRKLSDASIRLRFEKPQAIVFADAPAIEIYRTAEELASDAQDQRATPITAGLRIIKPYAT